METILQPQTVAPCRHHLTITPALQRKIDVLCGKFPSNEWSGVFFYTVEGSWKDGFTFVAKDLYPLNVGSEAYTEFSGKEGVGIYMADHDLLDCYRGWIHSHDSMPAFFSGTDMNTLFDNGKNYNHLLALVVCCKGPYKASLTRNLKADESGIRDKYYVTYGGGRMNIGKEKFTRTTEQVDVEPVEVKADYNSDLYDLSTRADKLNKTKEDDDLKAYTHYFSKPTTTIPKMPVEDAVSSYMYQILSLSLYPDKTKTLLQTARDTIKASADEEDYPSDFTDLVINFIAMLGEDMYAKELKPEEVEAQILDKLSQLKFSKAELASPFLSTVQETLSEDSVNLYSDDYPKIPGF